MQFRDLRQNRVAQATAVLAFLHWSGSTCDVPKRGGASGLTQEGQLGVMDIVHEGAMGSPLETIESVMRVRTAPSRRSSSSVWMVWIRASFRGCSNQTNSPIWRD